MRPAVGICAWLAVTASVAAYDFMERPRALLVGAPPDGGVAVGGTGFWQSAYRSNAFAAGDLDAVQVEAFGHHAILDAGRWRGGLFYGTHLLGGPVVAGTTAGAEAAQWIMNAVQYEYGLVVAGYANLRLGGAQPALLVEYSRRSYHPFLPKFSEPAADLLRIGVGAVGMRPRAIPPLSVDALVRIGWSEIYAFWGAGALPDPRARYTLHSAIEAAYRLRPAIVLFALAALDLIALRRGGVATDMMLQTGMRIGSEPATIELFLDGYRSEDTEQLGPDQATRAALWGWGVRFVLAL